MNNLLLCTFLHIMISQITATATNPGSSDDLTKQAPPELSVSIIPDSLSQKVLQTDTLEQYRGSFGEYPYYTEYHSLVSYDGKKVVYQWEDTFDTEIDPSNPHKRTSGTRVLDLETGLIQEFDIEPLLPKNVRLYREPTITQWCPYDNNKVLVSAVTSIDTGSSRRFTGKNIYIASIDGKYLQKVTPETYSNAVPSPRFGTGSWLYGSSAKADSIVMLRSFNGGIYVWQEKRLYSIDLASTITVQSKDGRYFFGSIPIELLTGEMSKNYLSDPESEPPNYYYLNGRTVQLTIPISEVYRDLSWSPDSRLVALSTTLKDGPGDETLKGAVWLLDIERFVREDLESIPVRIISLPEGFHGMNLFAEFLTNNSLIISAAKGTPDRSRLWEIDLSGNIIRQLTH